jgi:hypothetical protein
MKRAKVTLPPDAAEQLKAAGWSVDESTHPWVRAWCWRGPDGLPARYRLEDAWATMQWMKRRNKRV